MQWDKSESVSLSFIEEVTPRKAACVCVCFLAIKLSFCAEMFSSDSRLGLSPEMLIFHFFYWLAKRQNSRKEIQFKSVVANTLIMFSYCIGPIEYCQLHYVVLDHCVNPFVPELFGFSRGFEVSNSPSLWICICLANKQNNFNKPLAMKKCASYRSILMLSTSIYIYSLLFKFL